LTTKVKTPITPAQWKVLIALMLGVFMAALDISIVSKAIQVILHKFSISKQQSSYSLHSEDNAF
jgi:hypothetical protein